MAQVKELLATWDATWPSPLMISRQFDNGRYRIVLVDNPEPETVVDEETGQLEEMTYTLLLWTREAGETSFSQKPERTLEGPFWLVGTDDTQKEQDVRFQFCASSSETGYEAHSAIFEGWIGKSLPH